jgi:ComF family protein
VEGIHSWISYSHRGVSQRLIHHLKYFGNQPLGVWIGHQLGHHLLHYFADSIPFEGVIPVPLHPKKKKKRGFNQSAILAKGVAEVLSLPVFAEALVRTKNDKSQTSKNRFERFLNCSKRFDIGPDLPDIQSILIIDDVITTGSTLESCILPLQPIYPSISVASIAVVE